MDEVRDALEDDDSEASHIELAQEIIKSHADWNGSSSDSDLWDKITRAPLARREIAESADTFRGRMS